VYVAVNKLRQYCQLSGHRHQAAASTASASDQSASANVRTCVSWYQVQSVCEEASRQRW